jgi:nicotinate-nucleotide pyrophosphorylase (carboxylating)
MTELPDFLMEPLVRAALAEDLAPWGDATSRAVIPAGTRGTVVMRSRQPGIVSGMQVAALAFRLIDAGLTIEVLAADGAPCTAGQVLMRVSGDMTAILMAERVALNFAGRMCGIATLTAAYVAEAGAARITCTRKTTPGLRLMEKAAVAHGGGANHRYGLGDAILIKDNHIAAAGGVAAVLGRVKAVRSHMMRVEIEVDTLDQLDQVLASGGADCVLLDNMDNPTLARAVQLVAGRLVTEASGNMSLPRIAGVAATGSTTSASARLPIPPRCWTSPLITTPAEEPQRLCPLGLHHRSESNRPDRFRLSIGHSGRAGGSCPSEVAMVLAHLHRIDPEANMARFYSIDALPTLFGESSVLRCWGRIGTRGRTSLETWPTAAEAEAGRRSNPSAEITPRLQTDWKSRSRRHADLSGVYGFRCRRPSSSAPASIAIRSCRTSARTTALGESCTCRASIEPEMNPCTERLWAVTAPSIRPVEAITTSGALADPTIRP